MFVCYQIQIDIGLADESIISRSTCSRVQFRGFQEVFEVYDRPAKYSVREIDYLVYLHVTDAFKCLASIILLVSLNFQ